MSGQIKILIVLAIVALGVFLYLRNPPDKKPENSEAQSAFSTSIGASANASDSQDQLQQALWTAIAPCWNQVANRSTLPTKLKVSFDKAGNLAVPPEIERDPNRDITDDMLKSEATALAALSQCGPYPMAKGRQGVTVVFQSTNHP